MESRMEQNSVESRSGDGMSIFAQSIDVRRPVRSRRRVTKKVQILSPEIVQLAKPSTERRHHQRRAVVERERARAESELSRATTTAKELERQIDQASIKASSHGLGLQGTHASGNGREEGIVDVEAPDGDRALQSDVVYVEVMQELDRVKSELRKLQREVKSAREAMAMTDRDAVTPAIGVMRPDSRVPDGVKPEVGETNEERVVAEVAEAGGLGKGMQVQQVMQTRAKGMGIIRRDTSRASSSDTEEFATASSSDVESALTITQDEEEDDDASQLQDAEAELNSARIELASMKEEGLRFANSIDRTRKETARLVEEISRLKEQEMKASAQVQQLNAKLLRAKSRLEDATAADGQAETMIAELSSALRQLDDEIEAAEKERSLTELENQRVREEVESVGAEISAAEQRIRQSVKELEAARASEAAATSKLKAAVNSATLTAITASTVTSVTTPQRASGDVTVARFEYEYLTGRAEFVRAVAEKKVAAAEAWAEALRAGEKEVALRAEAIEKEIIERAATEAESAPGERDAPATSGRTRTPSSFSIVKKKKGRVQLSWLKVIIAGKRSGHR